MCTTADATMYGHAPAGGRPANAAMAPPPTRSANPIRPNPTRRSPMPWAMEFQAACRTAAASTAAIMNGARGGVVAGTSIGGGSQWPVRGCGLVGSGALRAFVPSGVGPPVCGEVLAPLGPDPAAL